MLNVEDNYVEKDRVIFFRSLEFRLVIYMRIILGYFLNCFCLGLVFSGFNVGNLISVLKFF